jgi:phosphoglycolate phosphatase-like HAD superfamily hydrolase
VSTGVLVESAPEKQKRLKAAIEALLLDVGDADAILDQIANGKTELDFARQIGVGQMLIYRALKSILSEQEVGEAKSMYMQSLSREGIQIIRDGENVPAGSALIAAVARLGQFESPKYKVTTKNETTNTIKFEGLPTGGLSSFLTIDKPMNIIEHDPDLADELPEEILKEKAPSGISTE